jgi:hypothetical protein
VVDEYQLRKIFLAILLHFLLEDGGNIYFRNTDFPPDYSASHHRRENPNLL